MHHGDGVAAAFAGLAAQGKVGDVDLMVAENRAYTPDHARHVAIAQINDAAFQRRLNVNLIHRQQPRRVAMQHRALHQHLLRAGLDHHREHVAGAAAGRRGFLRLMHVQTALLGQRRGIDQVRALR